MKDTMKPLRIVFYNALNGQITYDGNGVNVYDEKQPAEESEDVYIALGNQSEVFDETSDCFITRSSIDIEIIAKTGSEVSKDVIDDISDDLYQIIRPTPFTTGLADPSGFQIQNVQRESANTQPFAITDTQSVLVKTITFLTTITEQ